MPDHRGGPAYGRPRRHAPRGRGGHDAVPGRPRSVPAATIATWPPTRTDSTPTLPPFRPPPRGSTWSWLGRPVNRPWLSTNGLFSATRPARARYAPAVPAALPVATS